MLYQVLWVGLPFKKKSELDVAASKVVKWDSNMHTCKDLNEWTISNSVQSKHKFYTW